MDALQDLNQRLATAFGTGADGIPLYRMTGTSTDTGGLNQYFQPGATGPEAMREVAILGGLLVFLYLILKR